MMSRTTGKALDDRAHLSQSIQDILTTPLGSRLMRPEYGSRLFELVDQPAGPAWRVEVYAATAEALLLWEPRLALEAVEIASVEPGHLTLHLRGRYLPSGQEITLEGLSV